MFEYYTILASINLEENTQSNSITLNQLYNGDFPYKDEIFWDYVQNSILNILLAVRNCCRNTNYK